MKNSKRNILALFLALVMIFGLVGSASAGYAYRFRAVRGCLRNPAACFRQIVTKSTPAKQTTNAVPAEPSKPAEKPAGQSGGNAAATAVSSYEKAVADLVNEQRAKYGLAPLSLSADLSAKARVKSQDMASNRYFSHNSPTYGSPFDMMRSMGIRYSYAGENIAMGYASPAAVVSAWMNSEGHRANILSANYTTIGVGYVASGNYWTQWFLG